VLAAEPVVIKLQRALHAGSSTAAEILELRRLYRAACY
jgi:hypothetical protein